MRKSLLLLMLPFTLFFSSCGSGNPKGAPDPVDAIKSGDYTVVDVRTKREFAAGHVKGAKNIDLNGNFQAGISRLRKDGKYVLYCRSGNRSSQAKRLMENAGFTHVLDGGGLSRLQRKGVEVE